MRLRSSLFAAVVLVAACTPSPAPITPSPEAGDGSVPIHVLGDSAPPSPPADGSTRAVAACSALQAAGCEEGTRADCASVLDRDVAMRLIPKLDANALGCIAKQTTKDGVRACGGVSCK